MRISVRSWDSVDLGELAELTYAIKRDEMELDSVRAIPAIIDWLRDRFAQQARHAVLACSGRDLLGWLMLVVQNPARVEINPWLLGGHPLVAPDQDPIAVGARLLHEAITWAGEAGSDCVEFSVEQVPGAGPAELEAQTAWYGSLGFHIREQHVGLLHKLTEQDRFSPVMLPGFELRRVEQVDQDALYRCYYDAFNAGKSHSFLDQSERERRAHFDTFGVTYGIVEETSAALLRGGRIVGFTYVMPVTETHVHLDWMGIHPDYQRQGLARFLLQFVVSGAATKGVQTMSLSYDVENTPALELYRSCGWQEMDKGLTYATSIEGRTCSE